MSPYGEPAYRLTSWQENRYNSLLYDPYHYLQKIILTIIIEKWSLYWKMWSSDLFDQLINKSILCEKYIANTQIICGENSSR